MQSAPTPIATAVQAALTAAERTYKNAGRITGITTGLNDLDNHLGGLQPSDLIIIAGRPSMGKTALATNIGQEAAQAGHRTLVFELEMSAEQLTARMMAEATGISARTRRGPLSADQMKALIATGKNIEVLPLTIDDTAGATVAQLRARAFREKRQHGGLGLIVVDYLQLLIAGRAETRVQEVSEITHGLKMLAKELHVPVVALSQLSRAVERGKTNDRCFRICGRADRSSRTRTSWSSSIARNTTFNAKSPSGVQAKAILLSIIALNSGSRT